VLDDVLGDTRVPDATVTTCFEGIAGCVPKGEPVIADAAGIAEVEVEVGTNGFDGYFLVRGAGALAETTYLYKPRGPVLAPSYEYVPLLTNEDALGFLGSFVNAPPSSVEHTIYFVVHDCRFGFASEVTVEVADTPAADVGYFGHAEATTSGEGAGTGWIAGLEPDESYDLIVRHDGIEIGRERVFTIEGAVTYVHLLPDES
jgi:hypothetical protein